MYQHIMVPMDGSKLAECVLPHVEKVAGGGNPVKVTLVRVVPPFHLHDYAEAKLQPKEQKQLEERAKENASKYLDKIVKRLTRKGIEAEAVVLFGNVVPTLVDYTGKNGVELIVISTHGRSSISQLIFGSVAENILRYSCVPVLMVRAPGCVINL